MLTYVGQAAATRAPLDLAEVCRQSLRLLHAVVPKDIVLEAEIPVYGPVVRANATQVQQILTSLVTNAWEAVGDGSGRIRVTVATVAPDAVPTVRRFPVGWQSPAGGCACLEVVDTGCGIADADMERLFDPFFTSKFAGRGMGLAVILGMVRAHGGAITVESTHGTGSVFRVYLPVTGERTDGDPEPLAATPDLPAGGTALVVEDNDTVRTLTVAMLTRLGYTVLAAKDGVDAVAVFREHIGEIRFVLCDLTMPRMDGWETLTALRRIAPGIPVILASGYSEAHVMDGACAERPQAYLSKPYPLDELRKAIRRAMEATRS
jgi:CheY-like chemotaxis protein